MVSRFYKELCVLCSEALRDQDYEYQENGHPVHTICKTQTRFHKGDRVISRNRESMLLVGTVVESNRVYNLYGPDDFEESVCGVMEWVIVEFADGSRIEWSGQDVSTAPERLVGEAPPLYDTY